MTETENTSDTTEKPAGQSADFASDETIVSTAKSSRPWLLVFGTVFAIAFAIVAATMTGFLWWQYKEFYVSLDSADDVSERALASVLESLERVDDRLDSLTSVLEVERARIATLSGRIDGLPSELAVLEQRIRSAQGGSFDARSDWLRAEAEYFLTVANSELEIAGNWESSITALELADRRLAELADPAFRPVRELIADELIALRAIRLPDIEGLAFSLSRLGERAFELPMRSGRPAGREGRAGGSGDAEPGLERLWMTFKNAMAGLIRVERSDQPVARLLSAEESRLVARQVVLELQLARIAALRGETQAFQASLVMVTSLLRRDFDAATPEVEGAIELLGQMRMLEIAPAMPDISASLSRLRSIPAGNP
jgi:uncharacterized protein HemX